MEDHEKRRPESQTYNSFAKEMQRRNGEEEELNPFLSSFYDCPPRKGLFIEIYHFEYR